MLQSSVGLHSGPVCRLNGFPSIQQTWLKSKACSEASLACSKRVQQALQVVSDPIKQSAHGRDLSRRERRHPSAASAPARFQLTRIGGKATAGVIKDVVMLGGLQELEFDFVADNPGLTLFHCHQQLHMDFGFMALFNYA